MPRDCFLLLVSHTDKQTQLVFCGETGKCLLPLQFNDFCLVSIFDDVALLRLCIDRALTLSVDACLLLQAFAKEGFLVRQLLFLPFDGLAQLDRFFVSLDNLQLLLVKLSLSSEPLDHHIVKI